MVARATVAACAALACGASAFSETPAKPPTLDALLADAVFYGPDLSPNGRHLAGVRWENEEEYIVVADIEGDSLNLRGSRLPNARVNWIEWATDDRLLMAVTAYIDGRGRTVDLKEWLEDPDEYIFPVQRLFASDRDGGNALRFFDGDRALERNFSLARVTDFLKDDPEHILMPARLRGDLDLFKVNVITGDYERVAVGKGRTVQWFTDDAGQPAFRLDRNRRGTRLTVFAREDKVGGDIRWRKIKTIELKERRDKKTEQTEFRPLRAGPDPTTYYVIARPDGSDTAGIYLYDFEKDEFLETLASHPTLDITSAFFYEDSDAFAGYAFYEDRLVYTLKDATLQAHIDGLNSYFDDTANVRIWDVDENDGRWLVYATGPQDPGSWHIYDLEEARARLIGRTTNAIGSDSLAPAEIIRYTARDGLALTGYLTRPLSAEAGDQPPLIMMPHGGPELRDYYDYNKEVQILASLGYQVFQPNFRGSEGYGKTFADRGRREWGGAMQTDIDDGYAHLVSEGYVEAGRACIYGASYGGYASLVAAMRNDGAYRCAVSASGPSDLVKMLNWVRKEEGRDSGGYDYLVDHIGHPRRDKEMLHAVSPAKNAAEISIPVLLIHGEEDFVVPVEQSEIMKRALTKAGKDVTFVTLENSGHSYRTDADEQAEYAALLGFLSKHLPTETH